MVLIVPGFAWPALLTWLAGGMCASGLAWLGMLRWFARRLQGFTGDCLGATQQVGELAFYLGLALAWGPVAHGGHCVARHEVEIRRRTAAEPVIQAAANQQNPGSGKPQEQALL